MPLHRNPVDQLRRATSYLLVLGQDFQGRTSCAATHAAFGVDDVPGRLPNLLLIGSQKSATTSLADDLVASGFATLGRRKEPNHLARSTLDQRSIRSYRRNFSGASDTPYLLDASTTYSMRSRYPDAARNARTLLGPDVRLIYIVRQPFERMISHHRHEAARRLMSSTFDDTLIEHPELLQNSLYRWQLTPWLDQFDERQLFVLTTDEYTTARSDVMNRLACFLGVGFDEEEATSSGPRLNVAGESSYLSSRVVRKLVEHDVYRDRIRPLIPSRLRTRTARGLTSTEPVVTVGPTPALTETARSQMIEDLHALDELEHAHHAFQVPSRWFQELGEV